MSVASRGVTSISKNEFSRMFRQCTPPTGFSHKIGVANSGGPDSTCLLFLIHRYLSDKGQDTVSGRPSSVVSITVDHDLQPSSAATTKHCSKFAQEIGAEHVAYKIPWSDPPFPPRPSPSQAFENIARNARFHGLFQSMMRTDTNVVAFGHHSDDQVETCLMRLGRGTTELGAGGMKPCRRWGMGMGKDEHSLGWAGYEGMNKWIIRPLLGDRILATCDAHNLEYITDTTNFQPDITLRNALRHVIHGKPLGRPLPTDIADKLSAIDNALSSHESLSVDLGCGIERLRSAVSFLTDNTTDIDSIVDSALKRCMLPSPIGTILFSSNGLTHINDDLTRRAMILRALRYVSFHPWGSIRADANRRGSSMNQIIDKLWQPDPFRAKIRMFVAGGGVLWTPVSVRGNQIKMSHEISKKGSPVDGKFGWLASRQPPLNWRDSRVRGLVSPSRVDVTQQLAKAVKEWRDGASPIIRVLYDCRFLVHFNIEKIPGNLAERLVRGEGNIITRPHIRWRWYWPCVVAEWNDGTSDLLHEIRKKQLSPNSIIEPTGSYDRRLDKTISSEWIEIEWIRSLNAL